MSDDTRTWDDLLADWIDKNGHAVSECLILYGVRSSDDITDERIDSLLMDILDAGLDIMVGRALAVKEHDRKVSE